MNRPINWDWEELDTKSAQKSLEKTKSGSIAFLEDKDKLTTWKICHAHWETYLISHDYWKNWREKIKSFQTEKEVNFYTNKLRAFIDFVWDNTRKEEKNPLKIPQLVEQELKRLENISEEEFNKTDKWKKLGGLKELSTQEVLDDPWFSNEIDKFFGLNGKSSNETNVVYTNGKKNDKLTKKLLETLKQKVIFSSNSIKVDKALTSSEKQEKLKENQARLERLNSLIDSSFVNSNSNSLPSLFIGGTILLVIGLISFLVIRKHRKNK